MRSTSLDSSNDNPPNPLDIVSKYKDINASDHSPIEIAIRVWLVPARAAATRRRNTFLLPSSQSIPATPFGVIKPRDAFNLRYSTTRTLLTEENDIKFGISNLLRAQRIGCPTGIICCCKRLRMPCKTFTGLAPSINLVRSVRTDIDAEQRLGFHIGNRITRFRLRRSERVEEARRKKLD